MRVIVASPEGTPSEEVVTRERLALEELQQLLVCDFVANEVMRLPFIVIFKDIRTRIRFEYVLVRVHEKSARAGSRVDRCSAGAEEVQLPENISKCRGPLDSPRWAESIPPPAAALSDSIMK
jgi:hypothetical protein